MRDAANHSGLDEIVCTNTEKAMWCASGNSGFEQYAFFLQGDGLFWFGTNWTQKQASHIQFLSVFVFCVNLNMSQINHSLFCMISPSRMVELSGAWILARTASLVRTTSGLDDRRGPGDQRPWTPGAGQPGGLDPGRWGGWVGWTHGCDERAGQREKEKDTQRKSRRGGVFDHRM